MGPRLATPSISTETEDGAEAASCEAEADRGFKPIDSKGRIGTLASRLPGASTSPPPFRSETAKLTSVGADDFDGINRDQLLKELPPRLKT